MTKLRVFMAPHWENIKGHGESGIKTVVRKYTEHFEKYDIEIVPPHATSFDVLAIHAGMSNRYDVDAPVVAHVHGLYWQGDYQTHDWQAKANRDVTNSIRHATRVTVPTEWVAMCMRRDMHIDPTIVPHGVDWRNWQGGKDQGYVLWNKNRDSDACDPRSVVELAQRFPERRFLTTFAPTDSPPNIKATGPVLHEKMREMVLGASVYLSTTKETFGIGTLEAMAAGVPILCFDWGGNRTLVQHGVNGYLARPGDYHDLAEGLQYILNHRAVLGANGMLMARRWTWEQATYRAASVYYEAVMVHGQPHDVTVIIPCYNKGKTLERAVRSALKQTLYAARIIVVNNNSSDDSAQVAEKLVAEYPDKILFVNEERQGVAHARNAGIALAETRYVCCLDADDEIEPGFLQACVETLKQDASLGLAYTRLKAIAPDGTQTISMWPGEYNYDRFVAGQNQVPTCCVFRKELWGRLGGYRQRYAPHGAGAEDAEFWFRMGASGYRGKLATDQPLFRYHLGGSVSGNPSYREKNWRAWHPYVTDGQHPFASVATPFDTLSHPVRAYDAPRVSVIVPVADYHRHTLVDALDSIEGQTMREWEVIVVADGFNWDAQTIAAYPYAKFVGQEKLGAGAARNLGAEKASAPYLLFLDADDWLTPDALSILYHAAQLHPGYIVYGDYLGHAFLEAGERERLKAAGRLFSYDEKTDESVVQYQAMDYECEEAVNQPRVRADGSFYIWNLVTSLVPKLYHDTMGGFDEEMPSWEDWDYWLRLAWAGKCFVRVPRVLVEYRFYTGQRRALANPNESGEKGRHLSGKLLQYLQDKRRRSTIMACGGCKKHASSYSSPRPTPQMMAQAGAQRAQTMADVSSSDVVTVELVDGNEGDHPISFGGQFYGYKSHGDRFKMLRAHAVSYRAVRIVSEAELIPSADEPVARPAAPPAPQPIESKPGVAEDFELLKTLYAEPKDEGVDEDEGETITLRPELFDFTKIWGINEERAQMLQNMGVRTLDGFLSMEAERIEELFELQAHNVARMRKSAEKLK